MSTPYIGQLRLVAFNYPPKGYALCNGQLLPINQNQALFAVIGITYGGNGVTNFALPNLQSRVAISAGSGFTLGEMAGTESVTLSYNQMPLHTHSLTASTSLTQLKELAGNTVGNGVNGATPYSSIANGSMSPAALSTTGNNVAHENRSPYLVLNWVIALTGIFPTRN